MIASCLPFHCHRQKANGAGLPLPTIELEVDTSANDIFGQGRANRECSTVVCAQANSCRAVDGPTADIDVEILDLGGPVVSKGPLDAGAGRPAGLVVSGGHTAKDRLHIGKGATSRAIEQDAIGSITGAPAQCG